MKIIACLTLTVTLFPLPARTAIRTFVGGGGDANWNTPANWNPQGAPQSADSLVFNAGDISSNNNLSAATIRDLDFNARHTLTGNTFTLTHGITSSAVQSVTINPNITLGADQTFDVASGALVFNGAIAGAAGASRVVKNGAGTLRISATGIAGNPGGIEVNEGTLEVLGLVSGGPITMSGGTLTGDGNLASVSATGGSIVPEGGDLSISGSLTLSPGVTVTVKLTGPGQADILNVTGAVNLGGTPPEGGAQLVIDASAYQPVWDEDFTLLSKSGVSLINGIFAGLVQGAEVRINATTVGRISYTGGTGNDVVLDIISTTRTWDGGHTINDNWDEAENWSLNTRPNFGDVLVFPSGIQSTDRGMDNNFPNDTIFRQLDFAGDDFTVRGNRFKLSHGINVADGVTAKLDTSVTLALDQTFDLGLDSILHLDALDEIKTDGKLLRLTGKGRLDGTIGGTGGVRVAGGVTAGTQSDINFTARNTYSGPTEIDSGGHLRLHITALGVQSTAGSVAGPTLVSGFLEYKDSGVFGAGGVADDEPFFLRPGGCICWNGVDTGANTNIRLGGGITLDGFTGNPAEFGTLEGHFGKLIVTSTISGTGNLRIRERVELKGSQSNTFGGTITVGESSIPTELILEKSAPGVLAIPCQALKIKGTEDDSARVETRQDEQIADNCHVSVLKDGLLFIGNNLARTETIGNLSLGGQTTAFGSGVFGTNDSTLIVGGNITVPSDPAHFGADLEISNLRITATPCELNVGIVATTDNADVISRSTITRSGAASFRRTGPGIALFVSPVTVPFELLEGETRFRDAGGSPITLNGGAVGGNGTVGSIASLAAGGRVLPGEKGVGILTTGNLTWNAETTLLIRVGSATAGTGHDRLVVQGTVSLGTELQGKATLDLIELEGFNVGNGAQIFPLLNDGTDAIQGTFDGLPEGAFIPASTGGWTISYTGGDNNDVVLTRVPGPPGSSLPAVTNVTMGNSDQNGNRPLTIDATGVPGTSYQLENSVNLLQWTPEGTPQTAAAGTGALIFSSSASPPVRAKQFWRIRRL